MRSVSAALFGYSPVHTNAHSAWRSLQAGAEMYGGLGDTDSFGTHLTSQYLGPTINWSAPKGTTISFSPQFGLNSYSIPVLFRFSVSYEIQDFLGHFRRSDK